MAYAEVTELQRIVLKNATPSDDQLAWLDSILEHAAAEIDAEIDLGEGTVLSAAQQEIAHNVNLMRAQDLWQHMAAGTGPTPFSVDTAELPARYSWRRYQIMLAPLKDQQGFA